MGIKLFGALLFFGALAVWAIYMFTVYIPAISANPANSDALVNAIWWGIGIGIVGTIGATMAKSGK